jgi:alpha-beta hydrolase superfamily lysophospholipase
MQDNEFYIRDRKGHRLYGKNWTPDADPEAVIVIFHGFSDHINRYDRFARYFTGHRIAAVGFDMPGYGKSSGRRGHMSVYPWI